MTVSVKILADSVYKEDYPRLTTLEVSFCRFILPEFNTHRKLSRNFSSSRAIPTKTLLAQIAENPAMPVFWGKNQKGMQAAEELDEINKTAAKSLWLEAAKNAASFANVMSQIGAHKQIVNRLIEPFLYVKGVVSSTDWSNFLALRAHPDAQPEIQELAYEIQRVLEESKPSVLEEDQWHLPYITEEEKDKYPTDFLRKMSVARCCRVSYLKHDKTSSTFEEDAALCDKLASSVPIHASPFEHVAVPAKLPSTRSGNFDGWVQYREIMEKGLLNG